MTNNRPWRDDATKLLDAINSNFKAAEDQHKFTIGALCALAGAVLEVGEQLRIANRLTIAITEKDPIDITPETAATLGIDPQEQS
ncbi:hypothetical protein [Actinomyces massiliensis]|jgi:hypothetical protein|uniref:hypothetical protein n=1 Tax=Actinomyces massiliensis TaxID=461393 RepID=UPI0020588815|nr:hypothetical protein [Actinomyces massiliensis]DAY10629.1 MAG TPA: hypothetical protein [Caudoviricetes sp.]